MENEPQHSLPQSPHPSSAALGSFSSARLRRPWRLVGMGLLALGVVLASYFVLRGTALNGNAQDLDDTEKTPVVPTFVGWKTKPDLVLVVSGQMEGYVQPCGCSYPQKGGLARRYNFIQSLKDKGWPVAAVDLGDIAPSSGPQQVLKYSTSMKALRLMGYQAIGIGKNEFLMPFTEALAYSINSPKPRMVAVNLANTDPGELFYECNVRKLEVFPAGSLKVGVIGVIATETAKQISEALPPDEKDVKFVEKTAPKAFAQLQEQKVDVSILLYQGLEKDAIKCAELIHQTRQANPNLVPVQVMLCLTKIEEPPNFPIRDPKFPDTSIITVGHKGRFVGVVGFWKKDTGIETKYQLVAIGPEYETKPGKEKDNPVMDLIEKYAEDVYKGNFLARFPRSNHELQTHVKDAKYVGTETCIQCHKDAGKVWATTKHSKAFKTLVEAKNPRHRQFDGECVVCHTVGFKYHSGYNDPPMGSSADDAKDHNLLLENVGCESCHGPGSVHAKKSRDTSLYALINPYRPTEKELDPKTPEAEKSQLQKRRLLRIDGFCQKCHDMENDVHWGEVSFAGKWDKIAHPTMKKPLNAAQAK